MSCMWPVMRATGALDVEASHMNMVKSSDPDTSRSGRPATALSYRSRAACVANSKALASA